MRDSQIEIASLRKQRDGYQATVVKQQEQLAARDAEIAALTKQRDAYQVTAVNKQEEIAALRGALEETVAAYHEFKHDNIGAFDKCQFGICYDAARLLATPQARTVPEGGEREGR